MTDRLLKNVLKQKKDSQIAGSNRIVKACQRVPA